MANPNSAPPESLADAALLDLSRRTVLRLTGRDPTGMLNAVLTNEVPIEARRGVYALLLVASKPTCACSRAATPS